jgi:hypothetical protein
MEYVGIVLVVVMVFAALLVLRATDLGRRASVRPLPAVIRLLQAPIAPIARMPTRRTAPSGVTRPRRPRAPRPAPPPVLLPPWVVSP